MAAAATVYYLTILLYKLTVLDDYKFNITRWLSVALGCYPEYKSMELCTILYKRITNITTFSRPDTCTKNRSYFRPYAFLPVY